MNHASKLKHRAGVGTVLALLSFAASLAGVIVAGRMREAALRPDINLRPIIERLEQTASGMTYGYWQVLNDTISGRSDILAAAVVDRDGRILSTYPQIGALAGRYVTVGRPYSSMRLDDPRVESRFRALMRGSHGADWPALDGRLIMEELHVEELPRDLVGGPAALLVLPRPHQAAYELATSYLTPGFLIGAIVSLVLYWLMLPWWVYLDARPRTEKAEPLALFVLLTNFLGWLTYLVIRPEAERLCMGCGTLMQPSYRCCPQCGWSSQARCHQCGRPARPDWRFCPYCEAPRAESELAAARVAARREIEGTGGTQA